MGLFVSRSLTCNMSVVCCEADTTWPTARCSVQRCRYRSISPLRSGRGSWRPMAFSLPLPLTKAAGGILPQKSTQDRPTLWITSLHLSRVQLGFHWTMPTATIRACSCNSRWQRAGDATVVWQRCAAESAQILCDGICADSVT